MGSFALAFAEREEDEEEANARSGLARRNARDAQDYLDGYRSWTRTRCRLRYRWSLLWRNARIHRRSRRARTLLLLFNRRRTAADHRFL